MMQENATLAQRLGKTAHVSPLRLKLQQLSQRFPVEDGTCLEDWLIELANTRGARRVIRNSDRKIHCVFPDKELLSDEELVTGICQLQCLDRPQMLRLAAPSDLLAVSAIEALQARNIHVPRGRCRARHR